ncbi:HpcH/HpaI aldolase/citrate lyase family protein [Paeniroseomonas aquatica]|uniref:HpcH/HpaI aldolase/citrate lyase family protein n=1 Tax=Paeniroseomonas aquatica TaxID=373043 RepID=UPI0036074C86
MTPEQGCVEARARLPQRSELSVPATSGKFFAKAAASAADAIVLDLEDGVAPDRKDEARAAAIAALNEVDWGGRIMSVRVNGLGTPWCHRDIVEVAAACPRLDRIVLPKSSEAFDIRFLATLLDGVEQARGGGRPIGIAALVETAKGVGRVEEIAAAHPRLETVIFGLGDYMREMRTPDTVVGQPNPDYALDGAANDQWHYALARIANACRAAGVRPIDAVYAISATRRGSGPPPRGRGRWATTANGRSTRTRSRRSMRSSRRMRHGSSGPGRSWRCWRGRKPPAPARQARMA